MSTAYPVVSATGWLIGALQDNPNYSSEQVGFIAEDVQKIDPRLV